MEEIELKPCPFCGGDAVVVDAVVFFVITCDSCGANMKDTELDIRVTADKWNQRVEATSCKK